MLQQTLLEKQVKLKSLDDNSLLYKMKRCILSQIYFVYFQVFKVQQEATGPK